MTAKEASTLLVLNPWCITEENLKPCVDCGDFFEMMRLGEVLHFFWLNKRMFKIEEVIFTHGFKINHTCLA